MTTTRVVNIRDLPRDPKEWPADHVYIGRENRTHRLVGSRWANPFVVGNEAHRTQSVLRFERWITDAIREQPDHFDLSLLRGKTLVCWCFPKRCHGDVLARLADQEPTTLDALRDAEARRVLGGQGEAS